MPTSLEISSVLLRRSCGNMRSCWLLETLTHLVASTQSRRQITKQQFVLMCSRLEASCKAEHSDQHDRCALQTELRDGIAQEAYKRVP